MTYLSYWQTLPYWNQLSDAEKEAVESATVTRSFPDGSILRGQDDGCLGLIYLLKGSVRASMLSDEGREITLFRVKQGDACVFSASCVMRQITFDTLLTVEGETSFLVLRTGAFEELTRNNIHIRCFMYELAVKRFSEVMWAMQQLLFTRFDCRLSSFLLSEMQKVNSTTLFLTQEQVAREINSAREVVARMLRRFTEDGLVELKRGRILLSDPEGLKKICEK